MTQAVDPTTPPVNHTMSRRRFLRMGALVAALGFTGSTAMAGSRQATRSVKAASRVQRGKTTRTEKPIRSERHATSVVQRQRTTARSGHTASSERYVRKAESHTRAAHGARVESQQLEAQAQNRFAHIERTARKIDPAVPPADTAEKPLRSPMAQAEKSSVVTPSTSFTRPAYPVQSDYNVATPRSFAKMERHLEFYNTHTGESLKTVYWAVGKYLPSALHDVNWLLRDHHSNDAIAMDPELLDLLYNLSMTLEVRPSFQVISAYRSPATNAMLRMFSSGVAEHSQHIKGKAVDIRMPGCSVATIRRAALDLQAGGVGYYPWSNFVHLDTGPVRSWLA